MDNSNQLKQIVKDKYGSIAKGVVSSCCSSTNETCCSPKDDYSVFNDDYTKVDGYIADADLNLGCGLPTEFAGIKNGDTVVDLGSGAGNDVFVARQLVGETGQVLGIDMTPEMINRAEENKKKLGFENIEFRLGEIEKLPIPSQTIDVVISNCVLNLVPDKNKAFAEIFRILKPDGHFCISDVVYQGEMTDNLRRSAELYAGCVAGALENEEYLKTIEDTGFNKPEIKTKKAIELPDDLLNEYLTDKDISLYKTGNFGFYSITVVGYKSV